MAAKRLTKREKTLMYILLCLAISVGSVCLAILPTVNERTALEESLQTLEMQKMEMQIKLDMLPKNQDKLQELQTEYNSLSDGLLPNTVMPEALDIVVTQIAVACGMPPQSLSIQGGDDVAVTPYKGADTSSQESTASEEQAGITGLRNSTLMVSGSCDYATFVKLTDAFAAQGQLIIDSVIFSVNEEKPAESTFSITIKFYLIPPQGSADTASSTVSSEETAV